MDSARALCDALKKAGISNPFGQAAIKFCTGKCPYNYCRALESKPVVYRRERAMSGTLSHRKVYA
mgnify:CR=1 FL=1